jgi:poly-gamma-glutamate capsule biosynthesis protein CapA/YwtB (metallophosphatase superfamily)
MRINKPICATIAVNWPAADRGGHARRKYFSVMLGVLVLASVTGSTHAAPTPLVPIQAAISADPGMKPKGPLDPNRPLSQELFKSAGALLRVVAVGSLMISTQTPLPTFDPAIVSLLTGSDLPMASTVTIGDLETSIFNRETFTGYPYPWDDAPTPVAVAAVADDLRRLGFLMFSRANEHALDWGIDGMQATGKALDNVGVIHAGTGLRKGLAQSARYYDDPRGRGRIALVSAATTFRPTSDALPEKGASRGRAGVNALEVDPIRLVTPDQLKQLQQIACRYKHYGVTHDCTVNSVPVSVTTLGSTFETGDQSLNYTTDYRLNHHQAEGQLRFIREARENSDLLIVSLHSAQVADARSVAPRAPRFLETLAHASIDTGTDLVMNTGNPLLGPIEIYWATGRPPRPIFYGLGNFYWTSGLSPSGASANAKWSVITRTEFINRRLIVDIFPIDLSADGIHPDGWPHLANKSVAEEILRELIALSHSYGTDIKILQSGATYRGQIVEEGMGGKPNHEYP